jgi:4-amino-4-deoxy-L-arabinose transferase-like glycosyltransferase
LIARRSVPADWRAEALVAGGLLLIAGIVGVTHVLTGRALSYDEAMYASKARSLVSDIPAAWWPIHRPPGLAVLGVLAAPAGFSDVSVRLLTLVLGLVNLVLVWALARSTWGAAAGLIALAAAVAARAFVRELPRFHNDLVSTAALILLMLLLWNQFERRSAPNRLLLAAGPIAATAFYLRYGSALPIAVIGALAIVLWGRRMLAHARLVGATAGIAALLVLPHVLSSIAETGSPAGIMRAASAAANTTSASESLRQTLQWIPTLIGAPFAWLVAAVGVIHAVILGVVWVRRRAMPRPLRRHVWILGTAAGSALLIGIASHAEPRYQLFPLMLGLVAGGGAIGSGIEWIDRETRLGPRATLVARAGLAAMIVILVLPAVREVRRDALSREVTLQWWAETGALIASDADGPCRLITSVPPLVGWYARCETQLLADRPSAWLDDHDAAPTYVVLGPADHRRLPERLAAHQDLVDSGRLVPIDGTPEDVDLYRAAP